MDSTISLVSAALTGAGVVCAFEMLLLMATTFRRWGGLYFWSLLIGTVGQIFVLISIILTLWVYPSSWIPLIPGIPGYLIYVPAQSLVLYSRLHLLMASKRLLRFILIAAAVEFLFIEVPLAVYEVISTVKPSSPATRVYNIWWQIEAVVYMVLDGILIGSYIFQVWKIWVLSSATQHQKKAMRDIVIMSIFLIAVDIVYTIMSYKAPDPLTLAMDGFLYTFKLKAEIWSLNKLTDMSSRVRVDSSTRATSIRSLNQSTRQNSVTEPQFSW